jgi:hypothetical protein
MTDEDKIAQARAVLVEQTVHIWAEEGKEYGPHLKVYATEASMWAAFDEYVADEWESVVFDDDGNSAPLPDDIFERREIFMEVEGDNGTWHSFDSCNVLP